MGKSFNGKQLLIIYTSCTLREKLSRSRLSPYKFKIATPHRNTSVLQVCRFRTYATRSLMKIQEELYDGSLQAGIY